MPRKPRIPRETPRSYYGRRDPDHVWNINLRMGDNFVNMLDALCEHNRRSRREVIEVLVREAYEDQRKNL